MVKSLYMAKTENDAKVFVESIIKSLGANINSIEIINDAESGLTTISVQSPDTRLLIGRDGESLTALSTLLHRYLESGLTEKEHPLSITLDVNDYQKKHIEGLKTKAHMMAERAKFFKSSIELDPMNGYERRIIHTYLEKDKNITTESIGEGKNRRIVVKFIEEKTDL